MSEFSLALVGNPNCGKTALFNLLTSSKQKVANYAGVTVERKVGQLQLAEMGTANIIDLPGTYSLHAHSPDERVTLDVISGKRQEEALPDVLIAVLDVTNLRMSLRLALELKALKRPMIVALNMVDAAKKSGLVIDTQKLSEELGCKVVETVAIKRDGHVALVDQIKALLEELPPNPSHEPINLEADIPSSAHLQKEVHRLLGLVVTKEAHTSRFQHRLDDVLMHPFWGLVILAVVLFVIFQAVFTWASVPSDFITSSFDALNTWLTANMADGYLRSLLTDGILSGVGTVIAYVPQILVLFLFILILEDSGYLPRAAFLLDRLMGYVGLSGRAFIPMLSSFACAIPGVMATRSIPNRKDRIITIMLAPLMTCSARLPVYALLIGAFIPAKTVYGVNLQGLTLFVLYLAGVVSAMVIGFILKLFWLKSSYQPLMLELPPYRMPDLRSVLWGLRDRAVIFLRRVTGIILFLTIILWALSTFPAAPENAIHAPIYYSFAGMIGRFLEIFFAPIGFNWQISVALVPGMAAREVAVGALGTVYSLSASSGDVAGSLMPVLSKSWSMATALSLMTWYVYAPQCLSTLVVVGKEAGGKRYAWIMAIYMFALAYAASFVVYHLALWLS